MKWSNLERLGLGVSTDLSVAQRLDADIASGRLNYFNLGVHATQIDRLEYYLPRLAVGKIPKVFHTLNLNIADRSPDSSDTLQRLRQIVEYVQPRWMASDIAIWVNSAGVYLDALMLPPILDRRSVSAVAHKISCLQDYFGLPFMAENPPFDAPPASELHLLDFLAEVAAKAECGIVLDIGHLLTYLHSQGEGLDSSRLDSFPFELVGEVHLAGICEARSRSGRQILLDRHDAPIRDDCWRFLASHLSKMTNLKGLTLEQEHCSEPLMAAHLESASKLLNDGSLA